MKRLIFIAFITLLTGSCKSSKQEKKVTSKIIIAPSAIDRPFTGHKKAAAIDSLKIDTSASKAETIITYAKQFEGVRYKWGGTTKNGMDCSGLVFESFRASNILLPRISRDMAKKGNEVPLNKVKNGDLLFFKTQNRRNTINHVGLVITSNNKNIKFIHATTQRGVIVSSLTENYWKTSFVEARRIL
ncbi:C40 family peptidase [Snuella sedimenti]|uniref:C40 family peptidase n=1 Tax=Snuella sedimenti TaxID=2798802 RepID=A0A8J7IG78_9FLAO|nr:C40 family peptidase [Snuella sedimenti]MBJ6366481.1 C40 family peptidase [Snuella sedimenti]